MISYKFYTNKVKGSEYLMLAFVKDSKRITLSTKIIAPTGTFVRKAQDFIRNDNTKQVIKEYKKWQQYVSESVKVSNMINGSLEEVRDMVMRAAGIDKVQPRVTTKMVKKPEAEKARTFMEAFEEFVNTPTTKRKNNIHLKQSLRVFKEYAGRKDLTYDDMTLRFSEGWIQFMADRGLSPNTRGGHIKVLKAFLNDAYENGYHTNLAYKKFRKEKEATDAIYLNQSEIRMLAEASCRGMEEKARDMFLLGCYTGQRYSDCRTMKLEDMRDGYLYIIQEKTRERVVIPCHPKVSEILKKWKGSPDISEQNENRAIKQLCRNLGMTEDIAIRKRGKVVYMQKWELVTTHTARRSCVTNLHLSGENLTNIMAVSGHKSQATLNLYLKMSAEDIALKLKENAFFKV